MEVQVEASCCVRVAAAARCGSDSCAGSMHLGTHQAHALQAHSRQLCSHTPGFAHPTGVIWESVQSL